MKKYMLGVGLFSSLFADELPITIDTISVTETINQTYNNSDFYTHPQLNQRDFTLQETAPGFKNPIVDGLMGDRINLTVDGMKFSNTTFRSGPNQYYSWIPDEFTTDLDTNKADTQLGYNTINKTLGISSSEASTEYTSFNNGITVKGSYTDSKVSVGVFKKDFDDVETALTEVQHSAYNQLGFLGMYKSDDFGTTKLLFTESHDVERTDKYEQNKPLNYDRQQYLMLNNNITIGKYEISSILSNSIEKINDINNAPNKTKTSSIVTTIAGVDFKKYTNTYIIGLSEYHEFVEYQNDLVNVYKRYNDFDVDTASLYGTVFLPKVGTLEHNIKLDGTVQTYSGPTLNRDNNTYYSINGSYEVFIGDTTLLLSKSTRNPTLTNLAFDMTGVNGTLIPNPNLKEEQYKEARITHTLVKGLTVFGYYTKIEDYIVTTNNITQNIDAKIYGTGLTVSQIYNGIKLDGNIKYQTGKTDKDYMDKIVPLFGNVKLEYNGFMTEYLFSAKDNHQSVGDLSDTRIIEHNYGYNIVNIGYSHNLNKNNKVVLKGYNIFNNIGRVYGSSTDYYGRSFGINYTYSF